MEAEETRRGEEDAEESRRGVVEAPGCSGVGWRGVGVFVSLSLLSCVRGEEEAERGVASLRGVVVAVGTEAVSVGSVSVTFSVVAAISLVVSAACEGEEGEAARTTPIDVAGRCC